tara:strand:- start:1301 stop:1609 length:309 start_codon:yes stop_codon:yes gene_type:complete
MNENPNNEAFPILWWSLPLLAVAIVFGIWLAGFIFPTLTRDFAAGMNIGCMLGIIFAFLIPDEKFLYVFGSILTVPIAWFAAMGANRRLMLTEMKYYGWPHS